MAVLALFVAGGALVLLGLLVEQAALLRVWDDEVAQWAAAHQASPAMDVAHVVTYAGATVTIVVVTAVVVVLLLRTRRPRWAVFLLAVTVGQLLLVQTLKAIVAHPRPDVAPLVLVESSSFPSGHSAAAAATYLALALVGAALYPRVSRPLLVAVGVGIGVAVGASRVLLGVHWLSDVVVGLLLGWMWCLACLVVVDPYRWRRLRTPDAG